MGRGELQVQASQLQTVENLPINFRLEGQLAPQGASLEVHTESELLSELIINQYLLRWI